MYHNDSRATTIIYYAVYIPMNNIIDTDSDIPTRLLRDTNF